MSVKQIRTFQKHFRVVSAVLFQLCGLAIVCGRHSLNWTERAIANTFESRSHKDRYSTGNSKAISLSATARLRCFIRTASKCDRDRC